jgi:hypothetical protein
VDIQRQVDERPVIPIAVIVALVDRLRLVVIMMGVYAIAGRMMMMLAVFVVAMSVAIMAPIMVIVIIIVVGQYRIVRAEAEDECDQPGQPVCIIRFQFFLLSCFWLPLLGDNLRGRSLNAR